MVKSMDIRIQGTAQVTDRLGVGSALNDLQDFNPNDTSLANQATCPTHIGTEGREQQSVLPQCHQIDRSTFCTDLNFNYYSHKLEKWKISLSLGAMTGERR
jgi:hypothetical protein